MKHGLDRGSVGWTENRLNCCAQRELGLFNWRGEGSERSCQRVQKPEWGTEENRPDSAQWCPVIRQEAAGTNRNTGNSI